MAFCSPYCCQTHSRNPLQLCTGPSRRCQALSAALSAVLIPQHRLAKADDIAARTFCSILQHLDNAFNTTAPSNYTGWLSTCSSALAWSMGALKSAVLAAVTPAGYHCCWICSAFFFQSVSNAESPCPCGTDKRRSVSGT